MKQNKNNIFKKIESYKTQKIFSHQNSNKNFQHHQNNFPKIKYLSPPSNQQNKNHILNNNSENALFTERKNITTYANTEKKNKTNYFNLSNKEDLKINCNSQKYVLNIKNLSIDDIHKKTLSSEFRTLKDVEIWNVINKAKNSNQNNTNNIKNNNLKRCFQTFKKIFNNFENYSDKSNIITMSCKNLTTYDSKNKNTQICKTHDLFTELLTDNFAHKIELKDQNNKNIASELVKNLLNEEMNIINNNYLFSNEELQKKFNLYYYKNDKQKSKNKNNIFAIDSENITQRNYKYGHRYLNTDIGMFDEKDFTKNNELRKLYYKFLINKKTNSQKSRNFENLFFSNSKTNNYSSRDIKFNLNTDNNFNSNSNNIKNKKNSNLKTRNYISRNINTDENEVDQKNMKYFITWLGSDINENFENYRNETGHHSSEKFFNKDCYKSNINPVENLFRKMNNNGIQKQKKKVKLFTNYYRKKITLKKTPNKVDETTQYTQTNSKKSIEQIKSKNKNCFSQKKLDFGNLNENNTNIIKYHDSFNNLDSVKKYLRQIKHNQIIPKRNYNDNINNINRIKDKNIIINKNGYCCNSTKKTFSKNLNQNKNSKSKFAKKYKKDNNNSIRSEIEYSSSIEIINDSFYSQKIHKLGDSKNDSNSQFSLISSISRNLSAICLNSKMGNNNINKRKKKINNNSSVNSKNKKDKKQKNNLKKELRIFEENDEEKIINYYVSGNFNKIKNDYLQKLNESKKIEEKETMIILNCFNQIETCIKIQKNPRRNSVKEKKQIVKNHKILEDYLNKYIRSMNPLTKSTNKLKNKNKIHLSKKNKKDDDFNISNYNYSFSSSDSFSDDNSTQNCDNKKKLDRRRSHGNFKDKFCFKSNPKLIYDNTYLLKNKDNNQKTPKIKKEIEDIINSDSSNRRASVINIIDKNEIYKNLIIPKDLITYTKKNFKKNKDGRRFCMICLKPEKEEKKNIRKDSTDEKSKIFEKRLYDFFAKIQKLKNKGDDEELKLLIDEEIDKLEAHDIKREMRMNTFYQKFQYNRNNMMLENKFKLKRSKLRFMSPIIFSSYTTREGCK